MSKVFDKVEVIISSNSNGTFLNDWEVEKVLEKHFLSYDKKMEFQKDDILGNLKVFNIHIVFEDIQEIEIISLISELKEVGADDSVHWEYYGWYFNDVIEEEVV